MDICYIGVAGVIVCFAAAVWALKTPPQVPRQLSEWPSLGFLYLQLIRSALMRKRAPKDMKGKPIEVSLTVPARFDASRYAGFLKLVGCSGLPDQVPICYPFIESFRISMLAMSHRDFPFNVLGAVLARNTSTLYRKLAADEALTYSVSIDPNHVKNSKGDTEIAIVSTAADASGSKVWENSLTVIVINPKRQRGGGAKTAEATQESPKRELLAELSLPANAGRAFGALTGDRNPIHMHALTSQLFGFKKPIAHAMYIVSRLEAELAKKGYTIKSYPAVFETEFKRPTPLPNKLQATVSPTAQPSLQCAVLTRDGEKEVIVGRLYSK
eukprot:GHUV01001641.1.p1 GENE.GHUV01001641.1~~GHUV01001641.1.p1  ORF type:complete len:327 (+),score=76.16 GHUV01001641.1:118-1098(+)